MDRIPVTLALTALLVLGVVGALGAGTAWGEEPQPGGAQAPTPAPPAQPPAADQPFGWQLMTPEERATHCAQMQAAQTPEEREKLRAEHHAQMMARAKERGVALPATPMGPGQGCRGMGGGGMGMGRGMGGAGRGPMMPPSPGSPPAPPKQP